MTSPEPAGVPHTLASREWRPVAAAHAARADALTAGHRARRGTGERHPIDDFLYDYYTIKPSLLRRWHPGPGVVLRADPGGTPAEHSAWRWYAVDGAGSVSLDVRAFLSDRGDTARYVRTLLEATASRRAHVGCFGLHEWAMVFHQDDERRRHDLPLRLGRAGTDAVVAAHPIRCSHFDAFRFFAPDAVALNALQPTRATQVELEQPGCLHAGMDLFKWAGKLGPVVPGDLLLDCFELAREIRTLDMQASPYDVSSLGEPAVAIETAAGRAEYAARQREFAERAARLRGRLIEAIDAGGAA
ncbi:3-methyladenine DNA glycosylase [Pengzhenrongella sicca]|uniref:3-methyladenine DNA glycosylase n=1 Tax=Pengzhenrongella sicca TaxID=2819238 RepID=A0A8A4ZB81_9MICO|nr:3-methyladenine DNA glycosylase [Pengzhenrongella sicca]QTE28675.1 3-methyladenine DNA glycosylase [Pengzhenrongella sicca]